MGPRAGLDIVGTNTNRGLQRDKGLKPGFIMLPVAIKVISRQTHLKASSLRRGILNNAKKLGLGTGPCGQ